ECPECATLARRERAQRKALKAFGLVPLPSSLAGLFGGGGATIGLSLAAKTAAVVVVASAVGAGGYDIHHALQSPKVPVKQRVAQAPVVAPVVTSAPVTRERPKVAHHEHALVQPREAQSSTASKPVQAIHENQSQRAAQQKRHHEPTGAKKPQRPLNASKKAAEEGASFFPGRHLHP
ncbi:MAG TPA: hypothetical protein VM690_06790, partial [Gaiellaceae bacterium]|nr:hypothetical protein [Gaiellaceae bacterium]